MLRKICNDIVIKDFIEICLIIFNYELLIKIFTLIGPKKLKLRAPFSKIVHCISYVICLERDRKFDYEERLLLLYLFTRN